MATQEPSVERISDHRHEMEDHVGNKLNQTCIDGSAHNNSMINLEDTLGEDLSN